mgnify:CR=1 FL=1
MILFEKYSITDNLTNQDLKDGLYEALDKIGNVNRVLIIPPDFTRYHSRAGELTSYAYQYYKDKITDILPALGTHAPMAKDEIQNMFKDVPLKLFREHDWRNDVVTCGIVPGEYVSKITENKIDYDWPAQLNKLILYGQHDLILSIGQVVPHEVLGMANYNKNLFIGTGGSEGINKSHFVGAVYGMERIMGRAMNPVRLLLNYASENFTAHLPIIYVHTVVAQDKEGKNTVKGLFIGNEFEVFEKAAELSIKVNFEMLEKPIKKAVVYLDPMEYKSTWLGNKSIYRTRMAISDNGELIIIAPGVKTFGEDKTIDSLIRKYGYKGTNNILNAVKQNQDLQNNLGAAAHLIHGSSEGRFRITYCCPNMSKAEIESVGFNYGDINFFEEKYKTNNLKNGINFMPDGEEIFYISNPAIGLWSTKDKFNK